MTEKKPPKPRHVIRTQTAGYFFGSGKAAVTNPHTKKRTPSRLPTSLGMSTFKFWGIHENGERDLIGLCNARNMGEALSCWPSVVSESLADYHCVEVQRAGQAP